MVQSDSGRKRVAYLTQKSVNLNIKYRIEINHEDLKKYLEGLERTEPYSFSVSDTIVESKTYGWEKGYAEFLEFGTGPAHHPDPHERYWIGPKGEKALIEWAHRKLGMSKKQAVPFVKQLIFKIYQNGMAPHPFFRPAVYPVFDSLQQLFDEGYSFKEMCELMRKRCMDNIMTAGYEGTGLIDTGNLQLSLRVEPLEQAEINSATTDQTIQEYGDRAWQEAKANAGGAGKKGR